MAPSFDCAMSSLLCAEDNDSIFSDGDVVNVDEVEHNRNNRGNVQNQCLDGRDEFITVLPVQSDECLSSLCEKENEHLPNMDYLSRLKTGDFEFKARKEAIDWISKVQAHFNFGPLCAYLSINYLDRFLSEYQLPNDKTWMMQLLAVACLSLAAKMEETEVPLSLDLQVGESKFLFEAKTIQRMELLVLSTLKWKMQSVTPFSFIDNFLRKINDDQTTARSMIIQSIPLILSTIKGIDFLEFKPSEVAAAVAISIAGETKKVDTENAISLVIQDVQKERVFKCIGMIHDLSLINECVKGVGSLVPTVPQSPIGVLDAACLSYRSDDTTVGSCANSFQGIPEGKRRKLR
ncbi:Cyclin, C-terminal domain [Dillenia turbinata]|uniref:Cyclin, C-terminal domain n=1 Tax=Dillenia turbinata TaxID=194707 RepID=A0AAN8VUM2_9MAGN